MKKRFTLVELLGVIALILILSVLGYVGYSYATNSSKESATKALIARVVTAMDTCRTKNHFVPPAETFAVIKVDPGESVTVGGTVYKKEDTDAKKAAFYKIFMQSIEAESLSQSLDSDGTLCDGWGNPLYFRFPGKFNKGGFDLVSGGEDGKFGSGNTSTPPAGIAEYRDDSGDWIVDDVANF